MRREQYQYSCPKKYKNLGDQKEIYAEAGIIEYWGVNFQASELKVFQDLADQQYQTELTLTTGIIAPFVCPDVSVKIQSLFG